MGRQQLERLLEDGKQRRIDPQSCAQCQWTGSKRNA